MAPKEFSLEQIRMGHRFAPLTYTVSQDVIEKYTQAVDDPNPFYLDRSIAEHGPFHGIIAPPALASLYVLKAYRTDSAPPPGGIHLKQRFAFSGPMRPGDVLTVQTELSERTQKKGNWYLRFTSAAVNRKRETLVNLLQKPKAAKKVLSPGMLKNAPPCADALAGRQMQVELITQQNLSLGNRDGRFSASCKRLY